MLEVRHSRKKIDRWNSRKGSKEHDKIAIVYGGRQKRYSGDGGEPLKPIPFGALAMICRR